MDEGTKCYLCESRKADMWFNTLLNFQYEGEGVLPEVQQALIQAPICFQCMTLDDDDTIAMSVVTKQIAEGEKAGKSVYEVLGIHEPTIAATSTSRITPETDVAGANGQMDTPPQDGG